MKVTVGGVAKEDVVVRLIAVVKSEGKPLLMTKGKQKSYWKPQTSDSDVQGYIDAAIRKARSEGKVKPSQLKGYEYDVGRPIGTTDGRVTSRIKIQIDSNGYIHAHPWP